MTLVNDDVKISTLGNAGVQPRKRRQRQADLSDVVAFRLVCLCG